VPVPGQVSVVGFDDIEMAAMTSPALTTAAMPKREAGRAAVDLLLGLLGAGPAGERAGDHGSRGAPVAELGGQLIVRASTTHAAPPQPAATRRIMNAGGDQEGGGQP
jgi:DNA-binding LacI/PurR family transcriptional regulator